MSIVKAKSVLRSFTTVVSDAASELLRMTNLYMDVDLLGGLLFYEWNRSDDTGIDVIVRCLVFRI